MTNYIIFVDGEETNRIYLAEDEKAAVENYKRECMREYRDLFGDDDIESAAEDLESVRITAEIYEV